MNELEKNLLDCAKKARSKSYSPYSKFKVGCALKFQKEDQIYTGCNVENSSFGATICAERNAILKGVSDLNTEESRPILDKILVLTGSKTGDYPCGLCLQTISEFMDNNTQVLIANQEKVLERYSFKELMSKPFDHTNLPK